MLGTSGGPPQACQKVPHCQVRSGPCGKNVIQVRSGQFQVISGYFFQVISGHFQVRSGQSRARLSSGQVRS